MILMVCEIMQIILTIHITIEIQLQYYLTMSMDQSHCDPPC
jgi:hypothetical protein